MSTEEQGPDSLEELLDRLEDAAGDEDDVTLDTVLNHIGRRSFGPIMVLAGIVILMPLVGDIPGVPTTMAIVVLLTAGQLLFRSDHMWLPQWLLKRSVEDEKLCKGIGWMRKPAQFIDGITKHRMTALASGPGVYAIAIGCMLVAAATPVMEFVPFSANLAGAALTLFGLALITCDGLLALFGLLVTTGAAVLVVYNVI